jgi:hypothetical protein
MGVRSRTDESERQNPAFARAEGAGRSYYLNVIAPSEGINPAAVDPGGVRRPTEYTDPTSYRGRLGTVVPDVGWAERRNAAGQVDLISIPEITLVADMNVEGRMASHAMRKVGQFRGYLSAVKLRMQELRAQGQAVKNVEVRMHYMSDQPPSPATINAFEAQIRDAGVSNLTVYWARL